MYNRMIIGKCKSEYKIYRSDDDGSKLVGYNVGDYVKINEVKGEYYFFVEDKRVFLKRSEIENLVEIIYESDCFNACIRNGYACDHLQNHSSDDHSLSIKTFRNTCEKNLEVGRGVCHEYCYTARIEEEHSKNDETNEVAEVADVIE